MAEHNTTQKDKSEKTNTKLKQVYPLDIKELFDMADKLESRLHSYWNL